MQVDATLVLLGNIILHVSARTVLLFSKQLEYAFYTSPSTSPYIFFSKNGFMSLVLLPGWNKYICHTSRCMGSEVIQAISVSVSAFFCWLHSVENHCCWPFSFFFFSLLSRRTKEKTMLLLLKADNEVSWPFALGLISFLLCFWLFIGVKPMYHSASSCLHPFGLPIYHGTQSSVCDTRPPCSAGRVLKSIFELLITV